MLVSITTAMAAREVTVDCVLLGDRLMVPARGIFDSLGATVEWLADSNSVHITSTDKVIVVSVGEKEASINDEMVKLEAPAINWKDSVLVPVRFIGEALGCQIDYQDNRVVLTPAEGEGLVVIINSRIFIPAGTSGKMGCKSCGSSAED